VAAGRIHLPGDLAEPAAKPLAELIRGKVIEDRKPLLGRPEAAGAAEQRRRDVGSDAARYKVPREIVFLDELPRNVTGKGLKRELAAMDGEKSEA
jgi:acyl-CoA synthetase (AMP-forming)/AMP-acid ligase II